MNSTQIAGLDVIDVPGQPGAPCFVMLHGYGADMMDLAPLSRAIRVPEGTRWVFPNGPLQVPIGPGFFGRAWFPIDMVELERSYASGQPRDMSTMDGPELQSASQKVQGLIEELRADHSSLFLGGFSQGSMVALEVALAQDDWTPDALVLLSSAMVAPQRWEASLKKKGASLKRVFQSHGLADPILSPEGAKDLHELIRRYHSDAQWVEFRGGHEIPPEVIAGVNAIF